MNSTNELPCQYYIGVMSGTSLDGIDIAIATIDEQKNKLKLCHYLSIPYSDNIQQQLHKLNLSSQTSIHTIATLEYQLGKFYASAINQSLEKFNLKPAQIIAIGCHGQTVFHDPKIPMSIQLGHPAFIAKSTGITTVADFRIDDMANGGSGAPIAPAFHQQVFNLTEPTAIVNIGGIANVTIINKDKVIGFDTGPGNGLMDEVCQKYLGTNYDKNGDIAASTNINTTLLSALKQHSYFAENSPKSTGRDVFNLDWVNSIIQLLKIKNLSKQSLISTLNQLSVDSIANSIDSTTIKKVIICGGGAENITLLNRLAKKTGLPVVSSLQLGVNPHSLEAFMCAWLAQQRCELKPIQLTNITGATKNSILGGIWQS